MSHAIVETISHPVTQQVKNKLALLPEVVRDQLYDSTNFGLNHRLISNKVLCSTYIRGDILCLKYFYMGFFKNVESKFSITFHLLQFQAYLHKITFASTKFHFEYCFWPNFCVIQSDFASQKWKYFRCHSAVAYFLKNPSLTSVWPTWWTIPWYLCLSPGTGVAYSLSPRSTDGLFSAKPGTCCEWVLTTSQLSFKFH